MTQTSQLSGAGRTSEPSPLPPHGPSFARRHPFFAAFGVLAALSLFSAFWPVSAVITVVVVAARATGIDARGWQLARSGARWLRVRVARRHQPAGGAQPPGAPAARQELAAARDQRDVRTPSPGSRHRSPAPPPHARVSRGRPRAGSPPDVHAGTREL